MSKTLDFLRKFEAPARYIILSGAIYAYIFTALWITETTLNLSPRISYPAILASAYILDYAITGKWVFRKLLNWMSALKFVVFIAFSYILNVLTFAYVYSVTEAAVLSALMVAVILFLPRYYLSKKFVYSN